MPIKTTCPHCDAPQTVPDTMAGKKATCKSCDEPFTVKSTGVTNVAKSGSKTSLNGIGKPSSTMLSRKPMDDDDADRPRKKSRLDDDDDDRPRKKTRLDDEDDDDRPRKKSRRNDDDDYDDRPRKKKQSSKMALIIGLVIGGVLLLGGGVTAIILLSKGESEEERILREGRELEAKLKKDAENLFGGDPDQLKKELEGTGAGTGNEKKKQKTPKDYIVGKWIRDGGKDICEFTPDGKYLLASSGQPMLAGAYQVVPFQGTFKLERSLPNKAKEVLSFQTIGTGGMTLVADASKAEENYLPFRGEFPKGEDPQKLAKEKEERLKKTRDTLIGKWKLPTEKGITPLAEFSADGKVAMAVGPQLLRGTFKVLAPDSFEISLDFGGKMESNTLKIESMSQNKIVAVDKFKERGEMTRYFGDIAVKPVTPDPKLNSLDKVLASLKTASGAGLADPLSQLRSLKPQDNQSRRDEVVQALEKHLGDTLTAQQVLPIYSEWATKNHGAILVALLANGDPGLVASTVRTLVRLKQRDELSAKDQDAAATALLALAMKNGAIQVPAFQGLEGLAGKNQVAALASLGNNPQWVAPVTQVLANIKDDSSAAALVNLLASGAPSSSVQTALVKMGPQLTEKHLVKLLNHTKPEVATSARMVLKSFKTAPELLITQSLADLKDMPKRKPALDYLGTDATVDAKRKDEVKRAVEPLAKDNDAQIKTAAALVLKRWGGDTGQPVGTTDAAKIKERTGLLVGSWEGSDKSAKVTWEFTTDGKMKTTAKDTTIEGTFKFIDEENLETISTVAGKKIKETMKIKTLTKEKLIVLSDGKTDEFTRLSKAKERADLIVGAWETKKAPKRTMDFKADGKWKMIAEDATLDGEYKLLDEDNFEAKFKVAGKTVKEKYKIDTLTKEKLVTVDSEGKRDEYSRATEAVAEKPKKGKDKDEVAVFQKLLEDVKAGKGPDLHGKMTKLGKYKTADAGFAIGARFDNGADRGHVGKVLRDMGPPFGDAVTKFLFHSNSQIQHAALHVIRDCGTIYSANALTKLAFLHQKDKNKTFYNEIMQAMGNVKARGNPPAVAPTFQPAQPVDPKVGDPKGGDPKGGVLDPNGGPAA